MKNRPQRTNRKTNKSFKNVNSHTGRAKEGSEVSCCPRHPSGKSIKAHT